MIQCRTCSVYQVGASDLSRTVYQATAERSARRLNPFVLDVLIDIAIQILYDS
jgi:hypothetical protein